MLPDPMLPDIQADEFTRIVRSRFPHTHVLTLNAHTGQLLIGGASRTPMSIGLIDVINRTGSIGVASAVTPEETNTSVLSSERVGSRGICGHSEAMRRVFKLTQMVASHQTTVLITGESGTGKNLVAQEIHQISTRRKQPFVVVNCSAIPETLLESELFGFAKGAFTGAVQSRVGRIQAAHGGTLFLDEIGDMPLGLQSKILRFLEQGEVQRLGGIDNTRVDVRVIAATNAELKRRVAETQFRDDLYYRLAVFPIHVPPLRERMEDVKGLAVLFASKFKSGSILSPEALRILSQHSWPGNVRELRNVMERAAILMGNGFDIRPEHIVL
jgi:transcriptional regulator with GAF, ATPase, and Fis domain